LEQEDVTTPSYSDKRLRQICLQIKKTPSLIMSFPIFVSKTFYKFEEN